MDEYPVLSARARRAIPLIAAASAVVIVLSLAYLRPAAAPPVLTLRQAQAPRLEQQYWPAFDFVTPSLGWAAIASPRDSKVWVYRTQDGAKHWQKQALMGVAQIDIPSIRFFDASHGILSAGRVYRTSDGGAHWDAISVPDGTANYTFASAATGWAVDDAVPSRPIYETRDGGLTWQAVGSAPALIYGGNGGSGLFDFRADGEGWSGTDASSATLYATFDGGATWRTFTLPTPHPDGPSQVPPGKPFQAGFVTSVKLLPGNGVIASVDDYFGYSAAFSSFDRGVTWNPVSLPPTPARFGDISFVDARHWWASRWSFLSKTSDAGQTWQTVRTVVADSLGDWTLDPARVVDAQHAWLIARWPNGSTRPTSLAMSADGGVSWNAVNLPQPR